MFDFFYPDYSTPIKKSKKMIKSILHKTLKNLKTKQKKFKQQKGGQKRQNLASFKSCLNKLSGNDPISLLNTYFKTNEGKRIVSLLLNKYETPIKESIKNIGIKYNNCKQNNKKRKYMDLVAPFIPRKRLKTYGFKFGSKQYYNSKNNKKIKSRKKPVTSKHDLKIKEFLNKNSRIGANRTIKNKQVRYLNDTKTNLFKKYKNSTSDKISFSTFYKLIPFYYKKAKKEVDKCGKCEIGKKILRRLKKDHSNENLLKQLKIYKYHKFLKDEQKKSLENDKSNLKTNECIIIADFRRKYKSWKWTC